MGGRGKKLTDMRFLYHSHEGSRGVVAMMEVSCQLKYEYHQTHRDKDDQVRLRGKYKNAPLVFFRRGISTVNFCWHTQLSVELYVYSDNLRIMIWWERLLLRSPHTCGRCQEEKEEEDEEEEWVMARVLTKAWWISISRNDTLDNKTPIFHPADMWQ